MYYPCCTQKDKNCILLAFPSAVGLSRVDTAECNEVFADKASTVWLVLVILGPEHLNSSHQLDIWLFQCLQHFNKVKLLPYLGQDGR